MNKNNRISVLHLARWYPNCFDPMAGLFIQRHAEAASHFCNNSVVYVHPVEPIKNSGIYQVEYDEIRSVNTICVYYSQPKTKIPILKQTIKLYRFYKANSIGIKRVISEQGEFDLLHIHILTRLGLIGLYYKWFQNKPYLISEHWSRYLDTTGTFNGLLRKTLTRWIVKKASFVTTVTKNLAIAMKNHGLVNDNYVVLDNVVDSVFYQTEELSIEHKDKVTFINVTCFTDRAKNISGLLRVIKSMIDKRNNFTFILVGEGEDFEKMKAYASELGINNNHLVFKGLLEGKTLVSEMANANLIVMFSNYENLPVVINESFVLGIPVVSTNVGGISEILNDSNGVLIKRKDERALEETLLNYLDGKLRFEKEAIRKEFSRRFSPEKIGLEIFELYQKAL